MVRPPNAAPKVTPRSANDSRMAVPFTACGCACSRAVMSYPGGGQSSSAARSAAVACRVVSPSRLVSTVKLTTPGASIDATASIGVCSSSNNICSKVMSRTSAASPKTSAAAAKAISQ
ncbi:Uncharacterised protein [Mycobacterium tuberculosis]|nr:Uncharacterised protein [Mycobacterium tuberculosis]COZ69958.1 Uncharacterised protein [Mycobacterium tuberculosis]